jgi:hypothetical protein
MKPLHFTMLALPVLLVCAPVLAGGEIHGTVTTDRGERLTGPIRWDHNENFWDDVLDATKAPVDVEEDEGFELSIFGWKIARFGGDEPPRGYLSIRFGHLRSIEPSWPDGALLELKSGESIEALPGGDLGDSMRNLVVSTDTGDVELEWDEIERIEFSQGSDEQRDAARLYGTVRTRDDAYTGFVVWDRDESLGSDVLDGYDDRRRSREIVFADIRRIERAGHSRSQVTLGDGTTLELRGTNDVDDGNRGIDVTVPGAGKVEISWDEFESVSFSEPPASRPYDAFDGGRRLRGVVRTVDGETVEGRIVWDRDERYSWEALDGEAKDVDWEIPFANIRSIRPAGRHAADVELRNGDTLRLAGSNDVDRDNRGIIVMTAAGVDRVVEWDELSSVTFE